MEISVIIPTKNEEDTIGDVLKNLALLDVETIVVDDSTDRTPKICDEFDIIYEEQRESSTGKGGAMRQGVELANQDKLVFIDGDIRTFNWNWIPRLVGPLFEGYDVVKASYTYEDHDYVTKGIAEPLLEITFPSVIENFNRPLEGEMALKREVLDEIDLGDGFRVESEFVIDLVMSDYDYREVHLGKKKQEERKGEALNYLAREVLLAIINKAKEYHML